MVADWCLSDFNLLHLYLSLDFLPGSILYCHRPKQLYLSTNGNNTYPQHAGFHSSDPCRLYLTFRRDSENNSSGSNAAVCLLCFHLSSFSFSLNSIFLLFLLHLQSSPSCISFLPLTLCPLFPPISFSPWPLSPCSCVSSPHFYPSWFSSPFLVHSFPIPFFNFFVQLSLLYSLPSLLVHVLFLSLSRVSFLSFLQMGLLKHFCLLYKDNSFCKEKKSHASCQEGNISPYYSLLGVDVSLETSELRGPQRI